MVQRKTLEEGTLRRSLIATAVSIYYRTPVLNPGDVFETKKYTFIFRLHDSGPHFRAKDKQTDKSYYVECYDNYGEPLWGVYLIEEE